MTAHFEIKTYSAEIDIEGEGSVEIEPDQAEYEHGEEIELTPEPEEGYVFDHWVINGEVYEEETIEIEIDEDKEIIARFEKEEVEDELNTFLIGAIVIITLVILILVALIMKKKI